MIGKASLEELLLAMRTGKAAPPSSKAESLEHLSDQSILRLYEGIRHQVEADKALGDKYRLVGHAARERADRLREEILRRALKFSPIVWA